MNASATLSQAEIAKFRTEDEAIHARLEKQIAAVKSDIKNEKTARKEVDDELAQNVRALAETKVCHAHPPHPPHPPTALASTPQASLRDPAS